MSESQEIKETKEIKNNLNRQLTIGLEIHVKLKSATKMFCQCKNEQNFDTLLPNTNVCPVCTGQPGALPTLSADVLEKSLILGKALNCSINKQSSFDRKSYFYPDLPMGYQITQLYKPTNVNGSVTFFKDSAYTQEVTVHIQDAHMECDTAKMIHNTGEALLDFNRAGTPLVEIVTNPDFSDAEEVIEFLKELRRIIRYNNIGDADLEKGQMRVDVNISIRKSKDEPYGTRVELKNINSFGSIKRAIQTEYERQVTALENGEKIFQETRKRDDMQGKSGVMRSKEDALDYRYFPEPDLPPLILSEQKLEEIKTINTQSAFNVIKKRKAENINKEFINAILKEEDRVDYVFDVHDSFETFLKNNNIETENTRHIVIKRMQPIFARMNKSKRSIHELPLNKREFIKFLSYVQRGKLLENQLKEIMDIMLETGDSSDKIITEKEYNQSSDTQDYTTIIQSVLDANPNVVAEYRNGKTTTIGFFVGQVMKACGGKANPKELAPMIQEILG